jgi:hypothetical protein
MPNVKNNHDNNRNNQQKENRKRREYVPDAEKGRFSSNPWTKSSAVEKSFPEMSLEEVVFCERSLLWVLFGARNQLQHHYKPLTAWSFTSKSSR